MFLYVNPNFYLKNFFPGFPEKTPRNFLYILRVFPHQLLVSNTLQNLGILEWGNTGENSMSNGLNFFLGFLKFTIPYIFFVTFH
ncbi:MAG: hypothetical protein CM15mP102_16720 [Flavobacteriales bacterium]|nr:MAG: hypothetical protein CM15mP102_16720 [Flavobacteriales bacterium]